MPPNKFRNLFIAEPRGLPFNLDGDVGMECGDFPLLHSNYSEWSVHGQVFGYRQQTGASRKKSILFHCQQIGNKWNLLAPLGRCACVWPSWPMAIEGNGNLNRTQIPIPGKIGLAMPTFLGGRVRAFLTGPKEPLNISSGRFNLPIKSLQQAAGSRHLRNSREAQA